jgi:hypothetical protein
MELLCEVANMKCVRLLVASKQKIASKTAEGTDFVTGNTGRHQNDNDQYPFEG